MRRSFIVPAAVFAGMLGLAACGGEEETETMGGEAGFETGTDVGTDPGAAGTGTTTMPGGTGTTGTGTMGTGMDTMGMDTTQTGTGGL